MTGAKAVVPHRDAILETLPGVLSGNDPKQQAPEWAHYHVERVPNAGFHPGVCIRLTP
jgi:hypothetical protein